MGKGRFLGLFYRERVSVIRVIFRTITIFVGLILAIVNFLHASSVVDPGLSELSASARWIGRVHVSSIPSVLSGQGRIPVRRMYGEILEVYKGQGQAGESMQALVPGGQRGKKIIRVAGFGDIRPGQEVIIFLSEEPFGGAEAQLVGWTYFEVHKDSQGERKVFRAGESRHRSLSRNSMHALTVNEQPEPERLGDFVGRLYEEMK